MPVIKLENVKDKLAAVITPLTLSLLSGKETMVKDGVYMKVVGPLDFRIVPRNNGLEVIFKLSPQVRVVKFLSFYGDLTSIIITKNDITLKINGLPDVVMEAVS